MPKPPVADLILTLKQKRFVREYVIDMDRKRAAEAAGVTYNTVTRWLTLPKVQRAISRRLGKSDMIRSVDAERVMQELIAIGFVDPGNMFNKDGTLKSLRNMPENVRRAIASFEVESRTGADGETVTKVSKVKLHSKIPAIELIAKRLDMLIERREISISQETIATLLGAVEQQRIAVVDTQFIETKVPALPVELQQLDTARS